ncbi:dihydrofolate reductase [Paenibacillus chartarius]|uniref:Dihydrofolate reductase n=1 Tax=Paenibacillus chartarius TaxID=747481 RepID=A0ABV6DMU6_9BACL
MTIAMLLAMDRNNGIGIDNKLPWRLPADMAYFRKVTKGRTVLMGRKTHESIGKPLPNRLNVIVTRDPSYKAEGCVVEHSLEEALRRHNPADDELIVIGGAEICKAAMPYTDKLYITHIYHEFAADTFFPEIEASVWEVTSREPGVKDEENPYDYEFVVYERKTGT